MKIKALLIATILIYPLIYQTVASASCETMTAAEVSQFVQTHGDEWQKIITGLSSLSSDKSVGFVQSSPLQVYTITSESLQNYASQGSFKSTLVQTGVWYAPISIASAYNLLEIHCANNELKIVGTVGSRIVEQLGKLNALGNFAEKNSLIVQIEATKRLFLAVDDNATTTIYPIIEFPNQYASLKPINSLGGYSVSEVLLLIATEFLTTTNVATLSSSLNLIIPKAAYTPPTATGTTETFWVNLQYVPNSENRLLFEASEYHSLP
ncbi:MAG: hypothetical protein PHP00_09190 [Thiotrichaceae bacterium]|nr:hypothetical protein [Thiotrichaceae bacterium]